MLFEVVTMGAAAMLTAFVGTPVAVRLARAELPSFGGGTTTTPGRSNRDAGVTAGFAPLDLGPDPMTWPSASSWPIANKLPPAEWPSKSWDDEHFGRHWKDGTTPEVADGGFHAMLERRAAATPAPQPARRTRAAPPAPDAEAAFFQDDQEARRQKAIQESQRRAREQAQRAQQEAMRQQALLQQQRQQRARTQPPRPQASPARKPSPTRPQRSAPAPAPRSAPRPQAEGAPERAELEALVASEGLAGTVQVIMKRTGWDFRKAAQHLARVRAGK